MNRKRLNMYVYALRCQGGVYYIGKSNAPLSRITAHSEGRGAAFTRRHPPLDVVECTLMVSDYDEDNLVKTYMRLHGIDSVRGGSYTSLTLTNAEVDILEREIGTCTDTCFRCGRSSHFASECYAKRHVDGRILEECCFLCERPSHTADQCYAKTDIHGNKIN